MATRRDFMQQTTLAGAGLILASGRALGAAGEHEQYSDKLVDASGRYAAAPLPFAYDALEPAIDAKTVELHYNFHHKPAVVAANKAEDELAKARDANDFALVKYHEKELAFQLSSHILHTIYWTSISGKGEPPRDDLAKAINRDFGSYAKLQAQLIAATVAVEASGWGRLSSLDLEADDPAMRKPSEADGMGHSTDSRPRCIRACVLSQVPKSTAGIPASDRWPAELG
jgi:Fe-Mn family superoxide dismutase